MDKPNYIINEILNPLMEGCKHSFREGVLYLDLDNDVYMINVSLDNNGIFECAVHGAEHEFDLTDKQKDFIYLKVLRLYDDEEKAIKEFGTDINNY
jgi:hypothetical protein